MSKTRQSRDWNLCCTVRARNHWRGTLASWQTAHVIYRWTPRGIAVFYVSYSNVQQLLRHASNAVSEGQRNAVCSLLSSSTELLDERDSVSEESRHTGRRIWERSHPFSSLHQTNTWHTESFPGSSSTRLDLSIPQLAARRTPSLLICSSACELTHSDQQSCLSMCLHGTTFQYWSTLITTPLSQHYLLEDTTRKRLVPKRSKQRLVCMLDTLYMP